MPDPAAVTAINTWINGRPNRRATRQEFITEMERRANDTTFPEADRAIYRRYATRAAAIDAAPVTGHPNRSDRSDGFITATEVSAFAALSEAAQNNGMNFETLPAAQSITSLTNSMTSGGRLPRRENIIYPPIKMGDKTVQIVINTNDEVTIAVYNNSDIGEPDGDGRVTFTDPASQNVTMYRMPLVRLEYLAATTDGIRTALQFPHGRYEFDGAIRPLGDGVRRLDGTNARQFTDFMVRNFLSRGGALGVFDARALERLNANIDNTDPLKQKTSTVNNIARTSFGAFTLPTPTAPPPAD